MKNMLKSTLGVVAAAAVVGANIVPAVVSAYGDNAGGRKSITIAEAKKLDQNTIIFNSIEASSEEEAAAQAEGNIIPIQDERNYVGARVDDGQNLGKGNVWNGNQITVEEGKTYLVRLYVHNNNPYGKNSNETIGTAHNVNVSFQLPAVVGKNVEVNGYINAPDATITRYWDNVIFQSDRNFYLDYVEGSALIESNGAVGGSQLDDAIVTTDGQATYNGVKIGYNALDGTMPGCYGYAAYITIKVKPVFEDSSIQKLVRLEGEKEWKKSVDAKVGDRVEYQINYTNRTAAPAVNVIIRDSLPTNMKYVAGTTKLYNASCADWCTTSDDTLVTDGINIGGTTTNPYNVVTAADEISAAVRFTAEVVDNDLACGTNRLINWAKASTAGYAVQNNADVYVEKECKDTPKTITTVNELPETGAASIAAGVLGAGSIVTAAGYYVASRKQLRK